MSMYEVSSVSELKRILRAYDIVMIGYIDPEVSGKMEKEFWRAMKELFRKIHISNNIFTAWINARNIELANDVKTVPMFRVYYRGQIIFEQYGGFGDRELDLYVLRRSIRSVFEKLGITYKI